MLLKRSREKFNNISQDLKPLTSEAFRREGEGQNSRAYWILRVNRLPLSEREGCFQCEDLSIRKQGEGLIVEQFSSLKVEKKYRPCERMRSNPEKYQASSCTYNPKYIYPCHTVLDTVSHKLGMQDLLTARHSRAKHGNPAFLNFLKISNKLDPQTTSEDDANLMCLMFTPAIAKVSRVRHTTPQPTTKEVLC